MITFDSVSKRYGATTVLHDLSFTCLPGTVTGFLGPNGAGKSTALRILAGLARADTGTATVDGTPYRSLREPARTVGLLLDASAQHPGRTGREGLRLAATTIGVPRSRAAEVLAQVGLDEAAARKRVGGYSLGMRQRLAIAQALLGSPRVLVLDEPVNGLDPAGIHWMRVLLRSLADDGGTVLLSSHLLAEIEAVADHVVLLHEGRVRADVTRDELERRRTGGGGGLEQLYLELTAGPEVALATTAGAR